MDADSSEKTFFAVASCSIIVLVVFIFFNSCVCNAVEGGYLRTQVFLIVKPAVCRQGRDWEPLAVVSDCLASVSFGLD